MIYKANTEKDDATARANPYQRLKQGRIMRIGYVPSVLLAMAVALWLGAPGFPVTIVGTIIIVLLNYLVSRNIRVLGFALLPMICVTDKLFLEQPIPPGDSLAKSLDGFLSILVSDGAIAIMFVVVTVVSTLLAIYGPLTRLPSAASLIEDSTGKPPTEKR
jgi:hypothetical protein